MALEKRKKIVIVGASYIFVPRQVAKELGMARNSIYYNIKRLNINLADFKD